MPYPALTLDHLGSRISDDSEVRLTGDSTDHDTASDGSNTGYGTAFNHAAWDDLEPSDPIIRSHISGPRSFSLRAQSKRDHRSFISGVDSHFEYAYSDENTPGYNSMTGLESSTLSPHNNIRQAAGSRGNVFSFRMEPYPVPMRGRSYSDGIALSRMQRSSYLMNAVINAPSRTVDSPACSTVSDLTPTMAYPAVEPSYQWQPSFPSHAFEDINSMDHTSYSNFQTADQSPIAPITTINKGGTGLPHEILSSPPNPPTSLLPPPSPSIRSQDLRFPGDLYTPTFIRKYGPKREAWCGLCQPGRWLVLKNSAFWYDRSFTYVPFPCITFRAATHAFQTTSLSGHLLRVILYPRGRKLNLRPFRHGISAATGAPFAEPIQTRRGAKKIWEGLCEGCGKWVTLNASKRGGVPWFRHAYKVSGIWLAFGFAIADDCNSVITMPTSKSNHRGKRSLVETKFASFKTAKAM